MSHILRSMIGLASCLATVAVAAEPPTEFPIAWWHDRQTVEVAVGDRVTIALECRPGTGYRWHEKVGDRSILVELEPSQFEPIPDERGKPGGREIHFFRYVASRPGVTKWTATRARWSAAAGPRPERPDTFEVAVEVRNPR